MKSLEEIRKNPAVQVKKYGEDGGCGIVNIGKGKNNAPTVIWSNSGGWDHVSVSFRNRCPSWEEMCRVKKIFFNDDEACIEYHPAKDNYVNLHPYCLHMWKPQNIEIPTPPVLFV